MTSEAVAKTLKCKGKFCLKSKVNVTAVVVLHKNLLHFDTPCPCCGEAVRVDIPVEKNSVQYVLKTGLIGNHVSCSHCGWIWVKICKNEAQRLLCPEAGVIREGMKVVLDQIHVES